MSFAFLQSSCASIKQKQSERFESLCRRNLDVMLDISKSMQRKSTWMLAEIYSKTNRILQGSLHLLVYDISIDIPLPENSIKVRMDLFSSRYAHNQIKKIKSFYLSVPNGTSCRACVRKETKIKKPSSFCQHSIST